MSTTDTNGELREQLFAGKTLKQNLRDIIARNNTGHSYDELVEIVKDEENDEMLEADEVEQVDKTVNLLAHLFVSQPIRAERRARMKLSKKREDWFLAGVFIGVALTLLATGSFA